MAQANIDHEAARGVLTAAIRTGKGLRYVPKHPKAGKIADVMLGSHLTYRYVLLTNLLAKATNGAANALALQAGADLEGAFDSRSLCHKVLVDFDRDANQLAGKLGRSNEPYLNKPARYTVLATGNAVRRGGDRVILEKCIDILGSLKNEADARAALEDAIHYTMQRESLVAVAAELEGDATLHKVLTKFSTAAQAQSCEGESAAIITALAFYIMGRGQGKTWDIRIHPVNQAGSSSREVLDIDVYPYLARELLFAAEVKDKVFTYNDVEHAATKAAAAGLDAFFFVCGPQSQGAARGAEFVEKIADEKRVRVSFVDVEQFLTMALGLGPDDLRADEIWAFVDGSMTLARVKDVTKSHVIRCARENGLVSGEA